MKSEQLHTELNKVVIELNEVANPNDSTRLIIKFAQLFNDLYDQCKVDSYYWKYCPFDVYKLYIEQTRTPFLELFKDATEIDFYKSKIVELKENTSTGDMPTYLIPSGKVIFLDKVLTDTYSKNIRYSHFRKIEFLESEITKYNQPQKKKASTKQKKSEQTNEIQAHDLSNFFTREETCKALKISPSTLWRWTNQSKLKAYNLGGRVYYKKDDVNNAPKSPDSDNHLRIVHPDFSK